MRTKNLRYEDWYCTKCEKKMKYNRYRLSDLSPIHYCYKCLPVAEEE